MQLLTIEEPNNKTTSSSTDIVVGIDFGTTNSLIAYSSAGNIKIFPYNDMGNLLPSIIFVQEKNGQAKTEVGYLENNDGSWTKIRSIKRLLGKSLDDINRNELLRSDFNFDATNSNFPTLQIGGSNYSLPFLASKIFTKLKQIAELDLQEEIYKAVVTVPAYFDDIQRGQVMFAARLAGIEVLRLISEPTAAACAYGLHKKKEGCYLVYDLGGGTFDVSVINMENGVFQVLSTGGDSMLGGDDIDFILADYFANKNGTKINQDLLEFAKNIKEKISLSEGSDTEQVLTITKFEELILPIIKRTIQIASNVLDDTDPQPVLDGIILVGGATRITLIHKMLMKSFNVQIFSNINPDEAVAIGAALQADNLTNPASNSLLIDVLPLSLGLELYGGIAEKIILRNTPIPYSVTKRFTTHVDNQTAMQFHIIQGEREISKDCRSLAIFELKHIPPMRAGMAKIEVTFAVDANGILSVTALEYETGIAQNIEISYTHGLSDDQINQDLENAFKNAQNDHTNKLLLQTKLEATHLIDNVQKALSETPEILTENEHLEIKKSINSLQKNIISDNRDGILIGIEQLFLLSSNFIEKHINFGANKILVGQNINSLK